MTKIFHWFFKWKMDPMSGCDIRLVFTLPPKDNTLQYKRCVHLWTNFPCIITLVRERVGWCYRSKNDLSGSLVNKCVPVIVIYLYRYNLQSYIVPNQQRIKLQSFSFWFIASGRIGQIFLIIDQLMHKDPF